MRISLLGTYPPPYGGVSVHIQRLKNQLEKMGVSCVVYSYKGNSQGVEGVISVKSKVNWFLGQVFRGGDDIIHCHGYSPLVLVFLSLLALIKRRWIVITTHGFLFQSDEIPFSDRFAFWVASKVKMYFVVTSQYVREVIQLLGIKSENMSDIVSAFIAPNTEDDIPQDIDEFIKNHSPVIVGNAYKIVFFHSQDLYGIDMCVDLCAKLTETYPNVGLVFCLPDIGDYKYFEQIKRGIKLRHLESNLLLATEPCQLYPILKKCDVFVRPTNTDDFGVSVAEAIYFGIPAVASDVCKRAEGTILFHSRETSEFIEKVEDVLKNLEQHKKRLYQVKFEDTVESLVGIYRRLQ